MAVNPQPDLNFSATLVNGASTVTFPSVPYPRLITSIWMDAGIQTSAAIYRGQIAAPALKDSVAFAHPNTYNIPFILPSGQPLFIVFGAIAANLANARARLSSQRATGGYVS